jgi:hypothetical protein
MKVILPGARSGGWMVKSNRPDEQETAFRRCLAKVGYLRLGLKNEDSACFGWRIEGHLTSGVAFCARLRCGLHFTLALAAAPWDRVRPSLTGP